MKTALLVILWAVLTLAAPFRYGWWLLLILTGSDRAWRCAVAEDQAWNVPWGGNEDEVISSRAAKARNAGKRWGCFLCKVLDRMDPNHCDRNIESDR